MQLLLIQNRYLGIQCQVTLMAFSRWPSLSGLSLSLLLHWLFLLFKLLTSGLRWGLLYGHRSLHAFIPLLILLALHRLLAVWPLLNLKVLLLQLLLILGLRGQLLSPGWPRSLQLKWSHWLNLLIVEIFKNKKGEGLKWQVQKSDNCRIRTCAGRPHQISSLTL